MEYTLPSHESATSHLPGRLIEDIEVMQHAMCTEASAVRYNDKPSPWTGQPVSATDQVFVYGVKFFQRSTVLAAAVESIVKCAGQSSEIRMRTRAPTALTMTRPGHGFRSRANGRGIDPVPGISVRQDSFQVARSLCEATITLFMLV